MNKELDINNIYIGYEKKEEYSEFLEDYEVWEDHVLLQKTNYGLSVGNLSIDIYKNISNDEKLYLDKNGFVLNSKDEVTEEERYHEISNIISLKELLNRFETDKREDCQYRRYVLPIYEKVHDILNNKDKIDFNQLNKIFGNINDIHSYVFEIISEEEYEDLFGCKTYDFNTGSRIKK